MKKLLNSAGHISFGAALLSLCLSFFILLTPETFAKTPADTTSDAERDALMRQYIQLLGSVFEFAQRNYVDETDPAELYKGAMTGLMNAFGDPYTTYLDTSMMRDLSETTSGSFGGVGLTITKAFESTADEPAYVLVASPIEDGPGFKAGIESGDLIIAIDGQNTAEISMDDVLTMLRGKEGTSVELTIRRGKTMEFSVTLTRAIIEVPTVKYGMIDTTGYLRIIEFTPQTASRVQEALDSFAAAGYKNLIIDLRNNPGGLIASVADVADKFISSGTIVSTKSRLTYENSVYTASPKSTTVPEGLPIVVLINKGSASASEILAGALKDHHKAYLVGERTFGKGSVQQPIPLPNQDGIKLTIARYYTPSDVNIDKIGIPPDKEILFPDFSEEQEAAYVALLENKTIASYIEEHPNMTEDDIASYAETLGKEYALDLRTLRRLIRLETERKKPASLYDLDFDIQLCAALDILKTSDFAALVKNAKTLKELQNEAAKQEVIAQSATESPTTVPVP